VASNTALCCHVDRLEQLVLRHRSAFACQESGQQTGSRDRHMRCSMVPGNTGSHSVGSGSRWQACTAKSNVDAADVVLQKSCCTLWRSNELSETRPNVRAEKNLSVADRRVRCDSDDIWTVNNRQDRWQNVSDLLDVDVWPDGASVDTQCEYLL